MVLSPTQSTNLYKQQASAAFQQHIISSEQRSASLNRSFQSTTAYPALLQLNMSSPTPVPEANGENASKDNHQPSPPPQNHASATPMPQLIDLTFDDDDDLDAVDEVQRAQVFEAPIKEERVEEASPGPQELPELAPSIIIDDDDELEASIEEIQQMNAGEEGLEANSEEIEEVQNDVSTRGEGPDDMEVLLQTFLANRPNQAQVEVENGHIEIIDSDEEDARAVAAFKALKKQFESKKRRGTLTDEEEVEYSRAKVAEAKRVRLRQKNHANTRNSPTPEENDMFFPEDSGGYNYVNDGAVTDAEEPSRKRQKKDKQPGISSRELQQSMTLGFQAVEKKRRGRPKGSQRQPPGASKNKTASGPIKKTQPQRARTTQAAGGKKLNKREQKKLAARAGNLLNENSLFNNDIVADARANVGREGQQKFTATTRGKALKELVASIPAEHRDTAVATKKQLEEACRQFTCAGHLSIRADGDGSWKLKGMLMFMSLSKM